MEFDEKDRIFYLDGTDQETLQSQGTIFPAEEADRLLELVDAAETRAEAIDPSYFPAGPQRQAALNRQRQIQDRLKEIRFGVLNHAGVGVGDEAEQFLRDLRQ